MTATKEVEMMEFFVVDCEEFWGLGFGVWGLGGRVFETVKRGLRGLWSLSTLPVRTGVLRHGLLFM